ncbi:MAG: hypothetical protein WCV50_05445 [Patescibacteria group bacterium]|jgi:hypothetical protein
MATLNVNGREISATEIGPVTHVFSSIGVFAVKARHHGFYSSDQLVIFKEPSIKGDPAVYCACCQVKSIQLNRQPITEVTRGQEVGVKTNCVLLPPNNAQVFLVTN